LETIAHPNFYKEVLWSYHEQDFLINKSFSAVHVAAYCGIEYVIKSILESQNPCVNKLDRYGFSPLDYAVITNHTVIAQHLIEAGAKVTNNLSLIKLSPESLDILINSSLEAPFFLKNICEAGLYNSPFEQKLTERLNVLKGNHEFPMAYLQAKHNIELFINQNRVEILQKFDTDFMEELKHYNSLGDVNEHNLN
jgi:hypothetical protein